MTPEPQFRYFTCDCQPRAVWRFRPDGRGEYRDGEDWHLGAPFQTIAYFEDSNGHFYETDATGTAIAEGIPASKAVRPLVGEFADFDYWGVGPIISPAEISSINIACCDLDTPWWFGANGQDRSLHYAIRRGTEEHAANFPAAEPVAGGAGDVPAIVCERCGEPEESRFDWKGERFAHTECRHCKPPAAPGLTPTAEPGVSARQYPCKRCGRDMIAAGCSQIDDTCEFCLRELRQQFCEELSNQGKTDQCARTTKSLSPWPKCDNLVREFAAKGVGMTTDFECALLNTAMRLESDSASAQRELAEARAEVGDHKLTIENLESDLIRTTKRLGDCSIASAQSVESQIRLQDRLEVAEQTAAGLRDQRDELARKVLLTAVGLAQRSQHVEADALIAVALESLTPAGGGEEDAT